MVHVGGGGSRDDGDEGAGGALHGCDGGTAQQLEGAPARQKYLSRGEARQGEPSGTRLSGVESVRRSDRADKVVRGHGAHGRTLETERAGDVEETNKLHAPDARHPGHLLAVPREPPTCCGRGRGSWNPAWKKNKGGLTGRLTEGNLKQRMVDCSLTIQTYLSRVQQNTVSHPSLHLSISPANRGCADERPCRSLLPSEQIGNSSTRGGAQELLLEAPHFSLRNYLSSSVRALAADAFGQAVLILSI
ncbi:hypothetical protein QBC39DRAFT_364642 [Podospora conica]|nr:hypothetical protein QBC39DRAFT_364642 [Schizothecium conicum]